MSVWLSEMGHAPLPPKYTLGVDTVIVVHEVHH